MKRDINLYICDILESIELIEKYIGDLSEDDFLSKSGDNIEMKDAIMRRLEIIGEAVKGIPNSFKDEYSDISWKKIAGMRDILIHEYFGVVLERVWNTAKNDLPNLKEQILKILEDLKNS